MNRHSTTRLGRRLGLAAVGLACVLSLTGCSNALQGGLTGAGVGALAGMGLGSFGGHMGQGAAQGAILGGLFGAFAGDQNARNHGGWVIGGGGGCDY